MYISEHKNNALLTGKNFPVLREAFGLTQCNIADATGINRVSITNLEHGKPQIGANGIAKIQAFFDCNTTDEFIKKAENLKTFEQKTPKELHDLPPDKRKAYYLDIASKLGCPTIAKFIEAKPKEYDPKSLGLAVRNLRESLGMETKTLAARLYLSPKTISAFELGNSLINDSARARLPGILGCRDLDEVLAKGAEIGPLDHAKFAATERYLRCKEGLTNQAVADKVNAILGTNYPGHITQDMEQNGGAFIGKIKAFSQAFGFDTPQAMVKETPAFEAVPFVKRATRKPAAEEPAPKTMPEEIEVGERWRHILNSQHVLRDIDGKSRG